MLSLGSKLLQYGAMGRMGVVMNTIVDVASVIELNFGVVVLTVNGAFVLVKISETREFDLLVI